MGRRIEITRRKFLRDAALFTLNVAGGGLLAACARPQKKESLSLADLFPTKTPLAEPPQPVVAPVVAFKERPPVELEPAIHTLIPNVPVTNIRRPPILLVEAQPMAVEEIPVRISGEVPYFCQADDFFQDSSRCAIKNACGRTVAAMLLAHYGKIPGTKEAADVVINAWCGGTSSDQLKELTGQYGLHLEFIGGNKTDGTPYDPSFTKEKLKELVATDPVALTIPGHWTLVTGWENDHFILNDPYPPKWGVTGCEGKGVLVPEDTLWAKYVSTTWRALYVVES